MQTLAPSDIFLFEGFRLDRCGGLSRRDDSGGFAPVAIGSRALDILGVLIERAGEVLSKDEIIAAVWPGTVVEDSNLTVQISALRRVLDRGRSEGSCIQTVPGRGYRFVGAVTQAAAETRSDGSPWNDDAQHTEDGAREPIAPLSALSMPITMSHRRRTARIAIAAAVAAVLVIAAGSWWLWPATRPSPAPAVAAATSIAQPFAAPRMSGHAGVPSGVGTLPGNSMGRPLASMPLAQ